PRLALGGDRSCESRLRTRGGSAPAGRDAAHPAGVIHPDAAGLTLAAAAALLAGAVNAVGGGGTLISFPALLFLGFPPLTANVTNTVGLLPGYAGGSLAYRDELAGQSARLRHLHPVSAPGA